MRYVVLSFLVSNVAFNKRSVLVLIALGLVSTCLTLYTTSAHAVARYAFDGGSELGWLYTPPGSFLPWPKAPGMAAALSKSNAIDLFIYRYLIKSWVLVGITVVQWTVTGLLLRRMRAQLNHVQSPFALARGLAQRNSSSSKHVGNCSSKAACETEFGFHVGLQFRV